MKSFIASVLVGLGLCLLLSVQVGADEGQKTADIQARIDAYAPVQLKVDLERLKPRQRQALTSLVAAIDAIDAIYWKQMGRQALAARRAFADATSPLDRLYRTFVQINYGPFDIRDDNARFVDVAPGGERWPGAGFYPDDVTREEIESLLAGHPELRQEFERINTVIRRVDETLVAIPYERLYLDDLKPASRALKDAARLVDSRSLRRYLSLRAEALLDGDFYASDMAWLDVRDNTFDVVIGPIETYDDALLGLKASYEGAVLIKDEAGSRSLDIYRQHLDAMSRALPVDDRYKKQTVGTGNVLEIVNVVRFTGDFNAGIKTVAASLPNDERVIQEKGAKKQIYRNVLEAKFDTILEKIGKLFLDEKDASKVIREAFVTNVLMHELSHTLGVDYVAGSDGLTVRRALKERYSPIEEAKSDVVGIYNLRYLRDQEIYTKQEVEENYTTYLAGMFRAIRFGVGQAHGHGAAVQLNYLMHEGGIEYKEKNGTFAVHRRRFEPALEKLATELLEIEGTGDYLRAGRLLDQFGVLDGIVREALKRTEALPVDVTFTYPM
jgi:hypothetical protein